MTKDEIIEELKSKGYVVEVEKGNLVLSNNLSRVLGQISEIQQEKKITIELPDPTSMLKQFIKDCKIPFRAKTSQGNFYQLSTESDYARKALYSAIERGEYKYEDLVKATYLYYNNEKMARVTLTNYFKQGIFAQVTDEYLSKPSSLQSNSIKTNKVSL